MSSRPPDLRTRNDSVLDRCAPFLVAAPWHRDRFDLRPFGLPVTDAHVVAPTRVDSGRFLDRLETLDRLTFGPEGMPMPRWLFYEAAALPGGIFGFALPAAALPAPVAERLEVDGREGLVPLSMYIAIPARPPDTWFGHNLASLNRVAPELSLRGLGTMTKAFALRAYRCRWLVGATQWASPALHVHVRFGPLELLTAWTPAHADPSTLTYRVHLTEPRLRHALGDPAAEPRRLPADLEVATDDHDGMRRLQADLEAGARYAITGPPRERAEGGVVVPVGRLSAAG